MAHAEGGRPLGELFSGLASDISGLFRKEIELAKTEAGEKLDEAMKAGRNLAVGAILAIGAIGVLLAAFVAALTAMLVNMGWNEPTAGFVAALAVALIVGGFAWAMISRGLAELRANKPELNRTARSLRMDADAIRETI